MENQIYMRLNDLNIKPFTDILINSDIDNKTQIIKNLAKACYQEGVTIENFIPLLNVNDIMEIHEIHPHQYLNPSVVLDNQDIYQYLASTQTNAMFSLPIYTYTDSPASNEHIYTIDEDKLILQIYDHNISLIQVNNNKQFPHPEKVHRIVFKLEPYKGYNDKLKHMFQVTYGYACDQYYEQLQELRDQGIDEVDLPCICNPYLVQYYQNYRNAGWEFNRNSMNTQYYAENNRQCNVDHTLLLNKDLTDNLLRFANLNINSNNWTGIIEGEIEPHRHKTAQVSANRKLVGYKTKTGRFHTCGNMRLCVRDNAILKYPEINFDETNHIRYISQCIEQFDMMTKQHKSIDDIKRRYGFIFKPLYDIEHA